MGFAQPIVEEEFIPFDDRVRLCFLPGELVLERRCSGFEEGDFCSDRRPWIDAGVVCVSRVPEG